MLDALLQEEVFAENKYLIPSNEKIIKFCKEKLAPYKVPKLVEFRDSIPKSVIGKILRKVLREEEEAKAKAKAKTKQKE